MPSWKAAGEPVVPRPVKTTLNIALRGETTRPVLRIDADPLLFSKDYKEEPAAKRR